MTPEEILRDLRDIHLPEQAAEAASSGIVLWPVALVLMAAVLAAWQVRRRRTAWRREINDALDAIQQDADSGLTRQGWTRLAVLLRRLAMQQDGKTGVARLNGGAWLKRLDRLFGSDFFTDGPGRRVATCLYTRNHDDEAPGRLADDLRSTVNSVRKNLVHLESRR